MKGEFIMKATMINTNSVIKSICAVVILLGMSVSAWGAKTGTIEFGNEPKVIINSASVTGDDSQGNTWTITTVGTTSYTGNTDYYQVGSSSKPATSITFEMTLPASKTISAFSAKFGGFSGTAGTVTLKVGDTSVGSGSLNESTDVTISNSSTAAGTKLQVTVTSISKGVKCYYISCTYGNASAYKVTFDAEGGTCATGSLTEGSPDAGVTLPLVNPTASMASMGWGFYGWATSAVGTPTTTAPTIVGKAGDTYYPSSATTLHAVFAKGEYTKITDNYDIESGGKYLIVGDDYNNSKVYVMTHETYTDEYDNEVFYGVILGSSPAATYSAADVNASWRYSITGSENAWYIQNITTSKYVDTDNNPANKIYINSKTSGHNYTFNETSHGFSIQNNSNNKGYPYLVVYTGDLGFANEDDPWDGMLLYKETETPTYCSNPKTVKVVASPAEGGVVDFYLTSTDEVIFSDDEYVDIAEAAANDGYEFLRWETSNATNAKFRGETPDVYDLTTSTDDDPEFKATGDATLTAYFYKMSSVTLTLTGLTRTSGPNGSNAITSSVDAADIVWTFSLNDHYRSTPLTCSVTMGGSTLTEGAGNDYTWNASTKTLTIPAAKDITGDLAITVSATPMEYTKYAFSCSELTLTPKLVTDGAPIFITSRAEQTVRSQDSILVVGNGLSPNTTLTYPGLSSKFVIKTRLGAALETDENGEINAVAYIYYTPGSGDTSDGLDELTGITFSVGGVKPKTVVLEQEIYGRHLPEDFVIAGKKNGKWYAIPDTMTALRHPKPIEIAVDDADNPTIAYSVTTNYYKLYGQSSSTIAGEPGKLYSNGEMIKLGMTTNGTANAPLFGSATESTTIGQSGSATITNNIGKQYWWKLMQTNKSISNATDAKYRIYSANNTSSLSLRDNAGKPDWGLFASGVEELRLIPVSPVSIVFEVAEASVVEWGQHKAIVEFDNSSMIAHYAKATLNDVTVENIALNQTRTSVLSGTTRYNYTMDFGSIDFSASTSNGAALLILWYDISNNLVGASNITVPKIVASNITINKANYPLKSDWNTEVHVLPGKTVTVDADYSPNPDVTIKELNIYPGATVKVTSGTLDVTNLSLRNGWTRVGAKKYDVARLQIKTTANLTHKNAYLDWYIDNDQYYPVAVPFPVTVEDITYLNTKNSVTIGGTSGVIRLRYFDGANRAAGNSGNWKYYGEYGGLAVPAQLLPSMGYAMAAKRPGGKAFSIVRMPMTFTNEWTALGEQGSATVDEVPLRKDTVHVYAYGNDKTAEWNKGWNLIGNPYMAVFHGDDSEEGIYGKILAVSKVNEEGGEKLRYVTIPNSSFTDYAQVQYKDTLLKPSSSFLIQAKDTCRLEFSSAKIDVPSAPARYTATPTKAPEQEAYIRLSYEGGSDKMGLIIGEDYTAAYETNADLMKMLGEEQNTLKTYMMYNDVEMAYVAINEDLASEWIPITVRIPETGEYTYSLTRASEIDNLEGVYLIDYETNTVTNLIESNYSFVAAEGTIDDRFAINAIVGRHETPTDIDIINTGGDVKSDKPVKFIYNDKVFILHNGVIYDATGKKVREINR